MFVRALISVIRVLMETRFSLCCQITPYVDFWINSEAFLIIIISVNELFADCQTSIILRSIYVFDLQCGLACLTSGVVVSSDKCADVCSYFSAGFAQICYQNF